jgi:hypothetical protein
MTLPFSMLLVNIGFAICSEGHFKAFFSISVFKLLEEAAEM